MTTRNIRQQRRDKLRRRDEAADEVRTGWPEGMLQDDSRELSRWLSNKPGAKRLADEAAQEIGERDE